MKEKRDNIYIYLWEEFNTVYIGRTVNPKGRHYSHKHRESERTYQFSSEHHVEHPKMIIIENDLTIQEGVEREKYWINYYRYNTSYEILNKTSGGQIGGQLSTLSEEEIKINKKKYNEIHRKERSAYYKEYYRRHNVDKKLLKAQERLNKKILSYEKKICKIVHESRNKSYYESHKKQAKKYYEENKENIKNRMKVYCELNKEKIYERQKKYYELNKEKICEKKRKYYELRKKNLEF